VLNVKHSTTLRSSSAQSSRQVWDRVAQAAASSSTLRPSSVPAVGSQDRFPTLAASRTTPVVRQSQHNTAWSAAGSSIPSSSSREITGTGPNSRTPTPTPRALPPRISSEFFPTLPSSGSSNNQHKPAVSGNRSLQHILGDANVSSANAWGTKREDPKAGATTPVIENGVDQQPATGTGKGKKKKGKEKQTLFTLGSFPT
jgi:E3 ubiquitin-protein ligase ZNF598